MLKEAVIWQLLRLKQSFNTLFSFPTYEHITSRRGRFNRAITIPQASHHLRCSLFSPMEVRKPNVPTSMMKKESNYHKKCKAKPWLEGWQIDQIISNTFNCFSNTSKVNSVEHLLQKHIWWYWSSRFKLMNLSKWIL